MQHGRHWNGQDVHGWFASEKMDGCRGYWCGKEMWSRSGRRITVPKAWRATLPPIALEGEIWAGRGGFELTVAAVVRNQWRPNVAFIIFDAPTMPGTWEERLTMVSKRFRLDFAATVPWQRVRDMRHLTRIFRTVGEAGGEGLMLRCPVSVGYSPGRSNRVLKLTKDPMTGCVYPGRLVVERRMQLARRRAA